MVTLAIQLKESIHQLKLNCMETKLTKYDLEMSKYILRILSSQHIILWSWGFNEANTIKSGLRFNVNGFIHQGYVDVIYNEGQDLFDVNLLNKELKITKALPGIFFDELVNVIDQHVEKIENYNEHVKSSFLNLN